jgi:nitroreductase
LEAAALDLGAVPVGAFDDDLVRAALGLDRREQPLYVVPVGYPNVG